MYNRQARPTKETRMKPIRSHRGLALAACCLLTLASTPLNADVRSDEKTARRVRRHARPHGQHVRRQGRARRLTSTVAVKGDRKATMNDATGQIIDLDEEKVYDLDIKKKTYRVTTFAELRRRMEEARKKAEEDARKEQPQEEKAEAGRPEPEADGGRLRRQEHRREEDDQRLRHAPGRDDRHRAREGQDTRARAAAW